MQKEVLDHGFVRLVDSMPRHDAFDADQPGYDWGPGDQRVVDSARVSIAGEQVRPVSSNEKLLRYLLTNEHLTPFEQVRFTFHVKLPIFVARQWMRHRAGSFNEVSARYSVMPDEFYVPALSRMAAQAKDNKQGSGEALVPGQASYYHGLIRQQSELAYELYEQLINGGLARELARMVLPVNLYTQFYWTVDLRNLIHFLRLRLHSHAQYEIRVYAEALRELARTVAPYTVKVFEETV